ncbi:MAG: prepilin-type N-terminal cleavage/methylation domain-containing protein [Candidatus Saccharimonadales bacterium]
MSRKLKDLKRSVDRGFTIIEVMIVLAIAALIILIVLIAVPALQRSSRNTTIKSDAASVASAISNFETNNNGVMPGFVQSPIPAIPDGTAIISKGAATDSSRVVVKIQGGTSVLAEIGATGGAAPSVTGASALTPGQIVAWAGHECAPDMTIATPTYQVSSRAVAVFYVTENGGNNNQLQCIDT